MPTHDQQKGLTPPGVKSGDLEGIETQATINLRIFGPSGPVTQIVRRVEDIHARVSLDAGSARSRLDGMPLWAARRLRAWGGAHLGKRYSDTVIHQLETTAVAVQWGKEAKPVYRLDTYRVDKRDEVGWTGTYESRFTITADDEGNPTPEDTDPKVELVMVNGRATKVRFYWFHNSWIAGFMENGVKKNGNYLYGIPDVSVLAQFINGYASANLFQLLGLGDDRSQQEINLSAPHRCIELDLGDLVDNETNLQQLGIRVIARERNEVDARKQGSGEMPNSKDSQLSDYQTEAIFAYRTVDERFKLPGYAGFMKDQRAHFGLEKFAELALSMMLLFPNSDEEHA